MALMSSTGVILLMITEEGFLRDWVWASLKRAGESDIQVLVLSSSAFVLWHISAITLDTGLALPANETPIYLINKIIPEASWGSMRLTSGSIPVPAVSHAL